jgi:hypothetical protein
LYSTYERERGLYTRKEKVEAARPIMAKRVKDRVRKLGQSLEPYGRHTPPYDRKVLHQSVSIAVDCDISIGYEDREVQIDPTCIVRMLEKVELQHHD